MEGGKQIRRGCLAILIFAAASGSFRTVVKKLAKAEAVDTPVRLLLSFALIHFMGPIYGQIVSTLVADTLYNFITHKHN
jgi:hypothetical protein